VNFDLKDQIAIVTGAGSGIGCAVALALAAQGFRLLLVGRNARKLEEVRRMAPDDSRIALSCTDLEADEQLEKFVEALGQNYPQVDVLIHSAGVYYSGDFSSATVARFDEQYRINVRAPFRITQALLPALCARGGQVVFVNSSAGRRAAGGTAQYAATKHALKALADGLREEVNPKGVRVISIFPGRTATPMQAAIFREEGRPYRPELLLQPEDVAESILGVLKLKRTAEVMDMDIRPFQKF